MTERLFNKENIYLATGSAHPELAEDVAKYLDIPLGDDERKRFPSGERYFRYGDNVRGKHVFAIQSHVDTPDMDINAAIWEHGMMIDAAKRSSADKITAVSPHLGYLRQERQARGREAIGSSMIMNFLGVADGFVAIDLHSPATAGILQKPFDPLTAQHVLEAAVLENLSENDLKDSIVVAPDAGASKLAQQYKRRLNLGMFTMTKQRDKNDSSKLQRTETVPEVDGKICLVFDDMIDTAGTLVTAAKALKESGAKAVHVGATHGVFSSPALERLQDPAIDKIYVTDTFPMHEAKAALGDKLTVISSAPIIARAIIEIVTNGSVSSLFDDENHR